MEEGGKREGMGREIEKETYIHISGMLVWVCYPEKTLTKPKKLRFLIHFDYKIEAMKENGDSKPPAKTQYLDKDWEWWLGFIKSFQCLKDSHMSQWREETLMTTLPPTAITKCFVISGHLEHIFFSQK